MNRRRALQLLGAGAAGFAGCLDSESDGNPTTNRPTETSTTDSPPTADPTETAEPTSTDESTETDSEPDTDDPASACPGPISVPTEPLSTPDHSDASGPCPSSDGETRTVCLPAIDDSMPLSLEQSATRGEAAGSTFEFRLTNEADEPFMCNFHGWRLDKYVDGEWRHVAPGLHPQPLHRLDAGASHTWTLSVERGDLRAEPDRHVADQSDLSVGPLGGGHYAFRIDGWFERDESEERWELVGRFDLRGDPLPLYVTDAVGSVECDGEDAVVARASRPDDTEGDSATYILERLDGTPGDARRYIAEQLYSEVYRRDAIVLAERLGVDRVTLHDDSDSYPAVPDGPLTVEFAGESYRFDGSLDDPEAF